MDIKGNVISYWKPEGTISQKVYANPDDDDDFFVIYGFYNHKNNDFPRACAGVCWDNYPKARDTIAPIALPYEVSINVLNGMLLGAVTNGDIDKSQQIQKAISFLLKNHDKQ